MRRAERRRGRDCARSAPVTGTVELGDADLVAIARQVKINSSPRPVTNCSWRRGHDHLFGHEGDRHEHGDRRAHGGTDKIITGAGPDIIFGGPGNDEIEAGDGKNIVFGDLGEVEFRHGKLRELETKESFGRSMHGHDDDHEHGDRRTHEKHEHDARNDHNRFREDFGRSPHEHEDDHQHSDRREHGEQARTW
jgi:hypothetical protein